MTDVPQGCFEVGGKLYAECAVCGQIVKHKVLLGWMHACITDEKQIPLSYGDGSALGWLSGNVAAHMVLDLEKDNGSTE